MEISKQHTEASPSMQRRATRPRARDYSGPLGILAAGAIGLSLLCSVSAMAMGDLSRAVSVTIVPLNIVDLAVSNLETAAALTQQVVTVFVPTATLSPEPTDTESPSLTPEPSDTPRRFVTITPTLPRRTREPATATRIPTRTRTPIPPPPTQTHTRVPTETRTNTPRPTSTPTDPPTFTPIPPTVTNLPPTATTEPPTNEPLPTDTESPPTSTQGPDANSTNTGNDAADSNVVPSSTPRP